MRVAGPVPGSRAFLGLCAMLAMAALCWSPATAADVAWGLRVRLVDAASRGLRARAAAVVAPREFPGLGPGFEGSTVRALLAPEVALRARAVALDRGQREALAEAARWWIIESGDPGELARTHLRLMHSGVVDAILPARLAEITGAFANAIAGEVPAGVPNDPLFPNQELLLAQVDALRAWQRVRGEQGEVVIAVVDGGTDWRHPDLLDNVWVHPGEIPGNGIDDDGNGFVDDVHGWNFASDDGDPTGLSATPFNAAHGTHVAGLACAVTDNGVGVSGLSFNARLMPVNASDPERDTVIRYGYEGIVYAASAGADIINCSWRSARDGGTRSAAFDAFENAAVEAARAMGALVVAATGNDGQDEIATTPAFYPSVLSVTGTLLEDRVVWSRANAGAWVDLAAPATSIVSTEPRDVVNIGGGPYGIRNGTSMATPVVAGIAALLVTAHPEYTPEQIRQRLRATAFDLRDTDLARGGGAGAGLVQGGAAVSDSLVAELCITSLEVEDQDGDGLAEGGEVLTLPFVLHSAIHYDGPVQVDLSTQDPYLIVLEDGVRIPRLRAGESLEVQRGLSAVLRFEAPPGHIVRFDLRLQGDRGRALAQSFYREVVPMHAELRAARTGLSAAATGKLGYADPTREFRASGVGLVRADDPVSYLVLGGLVAGTGPDAVSDAVQAARPPSTVEDFRPIQGQAIERHPAPGGTELVLRYSDRASSPRLGLGVEQRLLAYEDPEDGDFVLSEWRLRAELDSLSGLYVGVFVDWSADRGSPAGDRLHTDPQKRWQWVEPADPHSERGRAAVLVLDGPGRFHGNWIWAIGPDDERPGPYLFDLTDLTRKLSDADLFELLRGRPERPAISESGNIAGMVSMGPVDLARGESTRLVCAFLTADDEAGLASAAVRATDAFRTSFGRALPAEGRVVFDPPPTPFVAGAPFRFGVGRGDRVRLDLYDVRGRRVRGLLDTFVDAGFEQVRWDGRDDAGRLVGRGVYFARLRAGGAQTTRRVVLVR